MQFFNRSRLIITAAVLTGLIFIGGALVIAFDLGSSGQERPPSNEILAQGVANSNDECVVCHQNHTPGIVNQYGNSDHFQAGTSCSDCHEVEAGYPGSVQHPDADFHVLRSSSTAMCENCHREQVRQFELSRHALPSYVAYAGTGDLSEELLAQYRSIPEHGDYMDRSRNDLHRLEGPAITRFACESCHNVGKPSADGSIGDCTACHLRHEFSLEQARKPETCNACHIGPDHPQWEIYQESAHGIAYMTGGHEWHWEAEAGTLTTVDFPAPTCATCHMSGFGASGTTHDVGDRLTWFLAAPISERRPVWQENKVRMQNVCAACHSDNFVQTFYTDADALTESVNTFVQYSDAIMQPLKDNGLLSPQPFDEPIDYTYFNLWHHWGRTAKFGAWMQGADYVQWHGAYEILHDLTELREEVDERLEAAGMEPLDLPEDFPSIDSAHEYLEDSASE